MTKDLIEGSKSKSYANQKILVAQQAQTLGIPYTLAPILSGVVTTACHYAETGTRLFPNVYSRASESVQNGQLCAYFGYFDTGGFYVIDLSLGAGDRSGVAAYLR